MADIPSDVKKRIIDIKDDIKDWQENRPDDPNFDAEVGKLKSEIKNLERPYKTEENTMASVRSKLEAFVETRSKTKTSETKKVSKQKNITLKEARGKNEFTAVLMNGQDSETINFSDYKEFEKKYKDVVKEFQSRTGSDDVWVDQIWVDRGPLSTIKGINWDQILLTGNGSGGLNKKMLQQVLEGEDVAIKIAFLNDTGYDVTENNLEDAQVYDASGDRLVDGNFGSRFPEGWLDEQSETYYSSLIKELEKVNGDSYFDWARLFSDDEANGGFVSSFVGDDYFVWSTSV